MTNYVTINSDGFETVSSGIRRSIRFDEVKSVATEKVGKAAYDEVFLVLEADSGGVVVGELDDGFSKLEQALRSRLPGFPSDWWASAEDRPLGIRQSIWTVSRKV